MPNLGFNLVYYYWVSVINRLSSLFAAMGGNISLYELIRLQYCGIILLLNEDCNRESRSAFLSVLSVSTSGLMTHCERPLSTCLFGETHKELAHK